MTTLKRVLIWMAFGAFIGLMAPAPAAAVPGTPGYWLAKLILIAVLAGAAAVVALIYSGVRAMFRRKS